MLTPTEKLQLKHFLSLSHYVWFYTYWEAFSASTAGKRSSLLPDCYHLHFTCLLCEVVYSQ